MSFHDIQISDGCLLAELQIFTYFSKFNFHIQVLHVFLFWRHCYDWTVSEQIVTDDWPPVLTCFKQKEKTMLVYQCR